MRTFRIVLEQHPDRAALFAQWKALDRPVAVDRSTPSVYERCRSAADEDSIVRMVGPRHEDQERFQREFMERSFPPPEGSAPTVLPAPLALGELRAEVSARDGAPAWYELAVALT